MGTPSGESLPISTDRDWRRVHRLRERYVAVAVGAQTWQSDQPRLTARRSRLGREPARQPDRVIFGGSHRCRIAPDVRRTFVIGSQSPEDQAAVFIPCTDRRLEEPLASLYRHRVRSMLVEGGPTLVQSFLREGLFDCFTAFVRTDSRRGAARAVRSVLSGLPAMDARDFGGGILLSWGDEEAARPAAS